MRIILLEVYVLGLFFFFFYSTLTEHKRFTYPISANYSDFLRYKIPDSHRNIFIVKTRSLFVDLSSKLISNIFSGVKIDFLFHKKLEQLALM